MKKDFLAFAESYFYNTPHHQNIRITNDQDDSVDFQKAVTEGVICYVSLENDCGDNNPTPMDGNDEGRPGRLPLNKSTNEPYLGKGHTARFSIIRPKKCNRE